MTLLSGACSNSPERREAIAQSDQAALTGIRISTTLNTYIASPLQIDQATPGSVDPRDANLFVGLDPADNTASYDVPTMAGTFIDWNDLGGDLANHQLMDTDGTHRDATSFPQSNSCVGSAQVLSKMDLTYVASANNKDYAYFAVQRSGNNGDAGYYWLFTKTQPTLSPGAAPCKPAQSLLLYDISAGDVLLAGHFVPNGHALLRVFHATAARSAVTAVDAIDFTNSNWAEETSVSSIPAVAVNQTPTAPGAFGSLGVDAMSGVNLGAEVFAEAAVQLSVFTGTSANCGAQYYGSVITRSSGSGGTSPDLKDLAGPALFNFGSVTATPTLTPKCDGADYAVTATGIDGAALVNPTCAWTFYDAGHNVVGTSSTCSGSLALSPGAYSASVTVTDTGSSCSATSAVASTNVYGALSVSLASVAATPACTSNSDAVTYNATASGGDGSYSYTWNGPTCSGASCVISPGDTTYCYSTSFTVTVSDPTSHCPDVTSGQATYSKVTTITATP